MLLGRKVDLTSLKVKEANKNKQKIGCNCGAAAAGEANKDKQVFGTLLCSANWTSTKQKKIKSGMQDSSCRCRRSKQKQTRLDSITWCGTVTV